MIPYLTVDVKLPEEILTLLQEIHKFYAIGMPHLNEQHAGYQRIKNIVADKINQLMAGKLPDSCQTLIASVEEQFNGLQVFNNLHQQFPNVDLSIKLLETNENNIERLLLLNLKISLLSNHFLIYYEDIYTFKQYKTVKHHQVRVRMISSVNEEADPTGKHYQTLLKMVTNCYPSHTQVNHRWVFTRFIKGGAPFNIQDYAQGDEYPIYNFLFGMEHINSDYRILS